MKIIATLIVSTFCLATDVSADMENTPIAFLGISSIGVSDSAADHLATLLEDELRNADGFRLLPGKSLDEVKLIFGCIETDRPCMARVGRVLKVKQLVWGTLQGDDTEAHLTLRRFNIISLRDEKVVKRRFIIEESDEALAGEIASELIRERSGQIRVIVDEIDADISLDTGAEAVAAGAPLLFPDVPPGTHRILVEKEGFLPWTRLVRVYPDETVELTAVLQSVVGQSSESAASWSTAVQARGPWRTAFWITAAATVAFAGTATGFWIARDNLTEDKEQEIMRLAQDPDVRDNPLFAGLFDPNSNACETAEAAKAMGDDSAQSVSDICGSASTFSALNIGFAVAAVLSGLSAGYLFYKGYIADDDAKDASASDPNATERPVGTREMRWSFTPLSTKAGAGLGMRLDF